MYITVKTNKSEESSLNLIDEENNNYKLISTDNNLFIKLKKSENSFEVIEKSKEINEEDEILTQKLNALFLELINEYQSGTETDKNETELKKTDDVNPYNPESIRVETKQFSIRQIYDMIKDKDIDISPDFQRNFVWDITRKSRLIESILLRIPIPTFYFASDENGRVTVVDGLQRLTTIRDFMDNKFKLFNLEYKNNNCENKYYSIDKNIKNKNEVIDDRYYRRLNMTQITVNVIDSSTPTEVKYDIFNRLNTGGMPLNSQEIRNCLAQPKLRNLLKKMATSKNFKKATGESISDSRMEAQELALRFIYFYNLYNIDSELNNYNGKIENGLNNINTELGKRKDEELDNYFTLFENAMQNAFHLFGKYSFRKCKIEHIEGDAKKQLINKPLFVSWSVLLSKFNYNEIVKNYKKELLVKPLVDKISQDEEFRNKLTMGTNSKATIKSAFKVSEEIIKLNLKNE